MKNILVLIPAEERHKEKLEAAGNGCSFTYASMDTVTDEQLDRASVIIGNVLPPERLQARPQLELLQLESAGADDYCRPGVLSLGTVLANSTGVYGKAVAEHCFITALMLQKKLELYRDNQNKHLWKDCGKVTSISDSTVLVVGLGDIGLHFARMAKALGAHTIGLKRRQSSCPEGIDELCLTAQLDEVLPRADIIASFLPNTPETTHIYTAERFEKMKRTAVFINGGRGTAVSSEVLYRALTDGKISAAGVDVTEIEPLPADSPLWDLPNLMITPHISGGYHLRETFERIVDIAADNIRAWNEGKPIGNEVVFATGYKK